MQIPIPSTYKDRNGTYYFRLRAASNDLKSSTFRFSLRTKDYSRAMDRALFCRHKLNQLLDGRQFEDLKLSERIQAAQALKSALKELDRRNAVLQAEAPESLSPAYATEVNQHTESKLRQNTEIAVSMAIGETLRYLNQRLPGGLPDDIESSEIIDVVTSKVFSSIQCEPPSASQNFALAAAHENIRKQSILDTSGLGVESITINALIERFLSAKEIGKEHDKAKKLLLIEGLLKHFGVYSTTDLTSTIVEKLRITLRNVPVGTKDIKSLLSTQSHTRAKVSLDRNKRFQNVVSELLAYAYEINTVSKAGLEKVGTLGKSGLAKLSLPKDSGASFKMDDLEAFFSIGIYAKPQPNLTIAKGRKKNRSVSKYWVPILCALHGFRLGEATKLRVRDVHYKNVGIPHIKIAYGDEIQDAKTASSVREVPIHPKAIEMGFLDFVSESKKIGYQWLFPDLFSFDREKDKVRASNNFSKQLSEQAKHFNPNLSVHSFRHTVIGCLRKNGVPESVSKRITGHSLGVHGNYGDYDMEQLLKSLQDMEISNLKLDHLTWPEAREMDSQWLKGKRNFSPTVITVMKERFGRSLSNL
ncbi:site-specific integrase [Grimontia hollisae]|uniref:site-specific integrase n=1 Tax=Grimontia hollisae TaxID=673 RepID=UPI00130360B4|nr:site-specific integrase [Grimontia hollisae]